MQQLTWNSKLTYVLRLLVCIFYFCLFFFFSYLFIAALNVCHIKIKIKIVQ